MWRRQNKINSTGELVFKRKKSNNNNKKNNSEIAVLEVEFCKKFSLPPTMVGALTQSCIKNGGSKIRLHETLNKFINSHLFMDSHKGALSIDLMIKPPF